MCSINVMIMVHRGNDALHDIDSIVGLGVSPGCIMITAHQDDNALHEICSRVVLNIVIYYSEHVQC